MLLDPKVETRTTFKKKLIIEGLVQFVDVNPDVSAFQRQFVR